ncbi:MAG: hypothetical protein ABW186_10900 [Rhodanobacteraceae bacterium]
MPRIVDLASLSALTRRPAFSIRMSAQALSQAVSSSSQPLSFRTMILFGYGLSDAFLVSAARAIA